MLESDAIVTNGDQCEGIGECLYTWYFKEGNRYYFLLEDLGIL